MRFTKMHGIGNDYVYVNCFQENVRDSAILTRLMSDRHTGVGADGLILIQPSSIADVRMEMYNADGSRGQMCGNGIRCVAKYAVDHGLVKGPTLRIETDAGIKQAECRASGGRVHAVRVNMGVPSFSPRDISCTIESDRLVNYPLNVAGTSLMVTCVSMGNPHAVQFVEEISAFDLARIGPLVESAPEFPERINFHIVQVDSSNHVTIRTWERGSGLTRACGTGACAVCVAGVITERTQRSITATLPGGDLEIEWLADNCVYMTGPAVEVFTGDWPESA